MCCMRLLLPCVLTRCFGLAVLRIRQSFGRIVDATFTLLLAVALETRVDCSFGFRRKLHLLSDE